MLRLIYSSHAKREMTVQDLEHILAVSRARNALVGITGLLMYRDGKFLQCLEGDAAAVRDTYARILRDPRHHRAVHLMEERAEQRSFPDWAMEFRRPETPWEESLLEGRQPPEAVLYSMQVEGTRPHA